LNFALEAFAVLIFTLPGMPLLYSGMEAGNYRRLKFFDKDCIDWKADKMEVLYTKLAHLRINNPALWSLQPKSGFQLITSDRDDKILSFTRESSGNKVLVVLNLSSEPVDFHFKDNGFQGKYKDVLTEMLVLMGDTPCFTLEAWGYRIWEGLTDGN
jgi:1,4-alpha-glucan branching enzyme